MSWFFRRMAFLAVTQGPLMFLAFCGGQMLLPWKHGYPALFITAAFGVLYDYAENKIILSRSK